MKDVILDNGEGVIKWTRGTFSVPHGTKGWPLGRATYRACKKFGEVLLKQGWALVGAPSVEKIRVSNVDKFVPKLSRGNTDINLWVPQGTPGTMREDHPWVKPGMDQYSVAWKVTRRSQVVRIDVPDRIIEKGLLPAGARLV